VSGSGGVGVGPVETHVSEARHFGNLRASCGHPICGDARQFVGDFGHPISGGIQTWTLGHYGYSFMAESIEGLELGAGTAFFNQQTPPPPAGW